MESSIQEGEITVSSPSKEPAGTLCFEALDPLKIFEESNDGISSQWMRCRKEKFRKTTGNNKMSEHRRRRTNSIYVIDSHFTKRKSVFPNHRREM